MKIKKLLIALSIVAVSAFGYSHFHKSPKPVSDDLFADVTAPAPKPSAPQPQEAPQTAPTPPAASSPGGSPGPAKISYQRSVKSISRQVAIDQFKLDHYYESIVSEVEGFRATMYNDNVGGAIGNGWNVSAQSKSMNMSITAGIGLSAADSQSLIALSGVMKPTSYPRVSITPEQATKAAQIMKIKAFEPVAIAEFGQDNFKKLKPNQQAVVVYHAYKTGNWVKWKNLKALVIKCANTQAKADCEKAGAGFTYSYLMNGVRMYDKRSNLFMNALFTNPEDYAYLLGIDKATQDFPTIAKAADMKIDPSKKADEQVEAQDDFGREKEKLLEKGIPFKMEIITPEQPRPKVSGGFAGAYF